MKSNTDDAISSAHRNYDGPKRPLFFQLFAMFLIIFGTKAALIATYGSSIPFWDQWDAEAARLYLPYVQGNLSISMLFESHNEHRILLTRLLDLALFELAGGWDPLLQMLINAVLHSVFIVSLVGILATMLPKKEHSGLVLISILLFMLPIGWENTISGFQSQFYFLLIFSLISIRLLVGAQAFSGRWLAGIGALIASYFSMASGALSTFAVAGVVILQLVTMRRTGLREWLGLAGLLAVGFIMLIYVQGVPGHERLKAQSVWQFLSGFVVLASIPLFTIAGAAIVQLPLFSFCVRLIGNARKITDPHWVVLGLAGWLVLQLASLAYGRAVGITSSRYMDIVLIALPLNYFALRYLVGELATSKSRAKIANLLSVGWLSLMILGLSVTISLNPFSGMFERAALRPVQFQNVQNFLATGDLEALANKPRLYIPYPSAERLAGLLSNPEIRSFLPASIRPADADVTGLQSRLVLRGRLANWMFGVRKAVLEFSSVFIGAGLAMLFGVYFSLLKRSKVVQEFSVSK